MYPQRVFEIYFSRPASRILLVHPARSTLSLSRFKATMHACARAFVPISAYFDVSRPRDGPPRRAAAIEICVEWDSSRLKRSRSLVDLEDYSSLKNLFLSERNNRLYLNNLEGIKIITRAL